MGSKEGNILINYETLSFFVEEVFDEENFARNIAWTLVFLTTSIIQTLKKMFRNNDILFNSRCKGSNLFRVTRS